MPNTCADPGHQIVMSVLYPMLVIEET